MHDLYADKPYPVKKFRVFYDGLKVAVFQDFPVAYKVVLSTVTVFISIILWTWMDVLLVLVVTGQLVMAELFNSAIEILCDFVEPNRHEEIKKIKDIAATAAGLCTGVWMIVVFVQLGRVAFFMYFTYGAPADGI